MDRDKSTGAGLALGVLATRRTRRAKEAASDALDQGNDTLEEALLCAKDVIRQHPITSVVVVAAVAYLWGRIRG